MLLPEDLFWHIARYLPCTDQLNLKWALNLTEIHALTKASVRAQVAKIRPFQEYNDHYQCMFEGCPHTRSFMFDLTDEDGPAYVVSLSWYCWEHKASCPLSII